MAAHPRNRDQELGASGTSVPMPVTMIEEGLVRVVVNYDACESNALCMASAPEVFEVRDDDLLYVLQEEPPDELREQVLEAVSRCPKQALSVAE